ADSAVTTWDSDGSRASRRIYPWTPGGTATARSFKVTLVEGSWDSCGAPGEPPGARPRASTARAPTVQPGEMRGSARPGQQSHDQCLRYKAAEQQSAVAGRTAGAEPLAVACAPPIAKPGRRGCALTTAAVTPEKGVKKNAAPRGRGNYVLLTSR